MDITNFLTECASTAYPEPESKLHTEISKGALKHFFGSIYRPIERVSIYSPNPDIYKPSVLDVGCGSGFMCDLFDKKDWSWNGITLDQDVVSSSVFNGEDGPHFITLQDMHDLGSFGNHVFDLVWARHVLEHSPIPLKVLQDFKRITKPNGYIYLEMPAPNTMSFHAFNPNHYSCFDMNGWTGLIQKCGLEIIDYKEYSFSINPPGREPYQDMYYGWYLRNPAAVVQD